MSLLHRNARVSLKILNLGAFVFLIALLVPSHSTFDVFVSSYGFYSDNIFQYSDEIDSNKLLAHIASPKKITFVGDVLLARNVEVLMDRFNGNYPYGGGALDTNSPDFVIGNFEASIPTVHQPTETNLIKFSVDKKFVPGSFTAGFTHFSLANNHSNDYGSNAFVNTKVTLEDVGLISFGSSTALSESSISVLDIGSYKVALVAIDFVLAKHSNDQIQEILSLADMVSDFVVPYVHWGEEYSLSSSEDQRKLAKVMVEGGADLIVGHHPHVVQEIGLVDGVPVFYSLGNYIFDQYFSKDVKEGLLITFDGTDAPIIEISPVSSASALSQPHVMSGESRTDFLSTLAAKSERSLQGHIVNGYVPLGVKFATSSKLAMITE